MRHRNASITLSRNFLSKAIVFLCALAILGGATAIARADDTASSTPAAPASDLQKKIDDTNAQIAQLEKEIAAFEESLAQISTQKNTLQGAINQLDLSRKKIGADISVTQTKVKQANLKLGQLGGAITDKQTHIENDTDSITQSLRSVYQSSDTTLVEHLLMSNGLIDAWQEASKAATLNDALRTNINDLIETKTSLTNDYNATNAAKANLLALNQQLSAQKVVLDQNRQDQANLLSKTKDKESSYQTLLAQKRQAEQEFERQLSDYEATLKYTLDPNAIPKAGSGVLSFPLDRNFMSRCSGQKSIFGNVYCITQYFGDTAFSKSGAYNGKGHNGIDFGSPTGTKVVAALGGTVMGTGNTDLSHASNGAQCYSYGKWVYIQHDNGLGTIYAHLSVISVSKGDRVSTGQFLGYSGETGYVTGPHLHFGLYVASQVKIIALGTTQANGAKTPCANAVMPVAPTQAYLNPLSYL